MLLTILAVVSFGMSAKASSNANGPYVILASSESARNTVDGNPLQITFDVTPSGTVVDILSNSACANADSQFTSPTVSFSGSGSLKTLTFKSPVDGSVFTFSLAYGQSTGTFTATSGGCSAGDHGSFCLMAQSIPTGTWTGTLDGNTGNNNDPSGYTGAPALVTFAISTSTFSMTGTTVKISAKLCTGGPSIENLTSSAAADAIGGFSSVQSGNVYYFNATDGTNTVSFIGIPTGVDGNTNAAGDIYMTYFVTGGVCIGSQGEDAPFSKLVLHSMPIPRMPIRVSKNMR